MTFKEHTRLYADGIDFFEFKHIVNPALKHSYIQVDSEIGVVVKTPFNSYSSARKLIMSKKRWIVKKIRELKSSSDSYRDIEHGRYVIYFAQRYSVKKILDEKLKKPQLTFKGSYFLYRYSSLHSMENFKESLYEFFKVEAKEYLNALVEEWSNKMELYPTAVKVRRAKRRWGSCSDKNSINFNISLMQLRLDLIEYVVVHELAHIAHKNHSKLFWQLVANTLPNAKKLNIELKKFSATL